LRSRWKQLDTCSLTSHPMRPAAYECFQTALWEALFANLDPGQTEVPVETRHPFVDLRLLRYMLAVPAVPWCRAKYLERRAMRGVLPASVLRRPKSPLISDPAWEAARHQGSLRVYPAQALAHYINFDQVPRQPGSKMGVYQV